MQRLLTADAAVTLIHSILGPPIGRETLCVLLDGDYRPVRCTVLAGESVDGDDVLDIAEYLGCLAVALPIHHVVIASSRPGEPFSHDDIDRWFVLDSILDAAGLSLLEWFVRDSTTMVAVTPLVGEPSSWPG